MSLESKSNARLYIVFNGENWIAFRFALDADFASMGLLCVLLFGEKEAKKRIFSDLLTDEVDLSSLILKPKALPDSSDADDETSDVKSPGDPRLKPLDDALAMYVDKDENVVWDMVADSVRRKVVLIYERKKARAYTEFLCRVTPEIMEQLMEVEQDPRVALIALEKIYQRKSRISKMHKIGAFAALRQGSMDIQTWADLVKSKARELRRLDAHPGDLTVLHQFIHHLASPFHQTRTILMMREDLTWTFSLSSLLDAEELLARTNPHAFLLPTLLLLLLLRPLLFLLLPLPLLLPLAPTGNSWGVKYLLF